MKTKHNYKRKGRHSRGRVVDSGNNARVMGSLRTYPRVVNCPDRPIRVENTPLRRQWLPFTYTTPTTSLAITPFIIAEKLSGMGIVNSSFSVHGIRAYNTANNTGKIVEPLIILHNPTGYSTSFFGVYGVETIKGALILPYASAGPYTGTAGTPIFTVTRADTILLDISYVEIAAKPPAEDDIDTIADLDMTQLPISVKKMLRTSSRQQ